MVPWNFHWFAPLLQYNSEFWDFSFHKFVPLPWSNNHIYFNSLDLYLGVVIHARTVMPGVPFYKPTTQILWTNPSSPVWTCMDAMNITLENDVRSCAIKVFEIFIVIWMLKLYFEATIDRMRRILLENWQILFPFEWSLDHSNELIHTGWFTRSLKHLFYIYFMCHRHSVSRVVLNWTLRDTPNETLCIYSPLIFIIYH